MHVVLFAVGAIIIAAVLIVASVGRRSKGEACVSCGAPSRFGYSIRAESDLKDVVRLCLTCLKTKLAADYQRFGARALVIEPTAALPCYVFQPSGKWKGRKLVEEAAALLSKMENSCHRCSGKANFLWLTSKGLQVDNQDRLFAEGVSETLLRWGNLPPFPVCARCCVNLICDGIESRSLTFLEVCGPLSEDGFVLPMAY